MNSKLEGDLPDDELFSALEQIKGLQAAKIEIARQLSYVIV
jgi:hypothetical protein